MILTIKNVKELYYDFDIDLSDIEIMLLIEALEGEELTESNIMEILDGIRT